MKILSLLKLHKNKTATLTEEQKKFVEFGREQIEKLRQKNLTLQVAFL